MKIRVIFVVLLFAIICGCTDKVEPVCVNLNTISFSADITYYNEKYSCDCFTDNQGNFTANITAPENLKDLSLEFSDNSCKILFGGIEVAGAERFLPETAAVGILNNIIKFCNGKECDNSKQNQTINGDINKNKFTLTVSPTGLPISLNIPDYGMTVDFKNVTLIKQEK